MAGNTEIGAVVSERRLPTLSDPDAVVRLELNIDGLEYLANELPQDDGFTKKLWALLEQVAPEER